VPPRVVASLLPLAVATVVFGVVSTLAGACGRTGTLARGLVGIWSRLVLWFWGVRVVVTGTENLPARGPAVYAANHTSALDIPILFGRLPADFRIIHKRSLYKLPLFGWYLWAGKHVGIDRANPFSARRSLDQAARRIAAGTSLAVFPEGSRSGDGRIHRFKKGGFVLALKAGVDVIPVSLVGVAGLVPEGLFRVRRGTVRMVIHPALPTRGRRIKDAAAMAEEVRRIVKAGCEAA
jgi:1-acyl-sn-glycerol-3-phosphate acyltransferase